MRNADDNAKLHRRGRALNVNGLDHAVMTRWGPLASVVSARMPISAAVEVWSEAIKVGVFLSINGGGCARRSATAHQARP